jgi:2-keto-4-pentenoate hydratase/2-oxohepta-3-ene-1,7-dioic acid hydratase in catechol pathway
VVDVGRGSGTLRTALEDLSAVREAAGRAPDFGLDDVTFLPPVSDPQKILCLGLNYLRHIKEVGREQPEKPMFFTRFTNTQVGHKQPLVRPKLSDKFDYEGELAFVIGKRCRYVDPKDGLSVIAGYSCYNDASVRDWQRHTTQYTPGKNFPSTGGFGPFLVTPDEAGDIKAKTITTRLNGSVMQNDSLSECLFELPAIVAYVSSFTELVPGDVILTGTPAGVGAGRNPPVWMKGGDVVEVEISGIGTLRNPVVDEQ